MTTYPSQLSADLAQLMGLDEAFWDDIAARDLADRNMCAAQRRDEAIMLAAVLASAESARDRNDGSY